MFDDAILNQNGIYKNKWSKKGVQNGYDAGDQYFLK